MDEGLFPEPKFEDTASCDKRNSDDKAKNSTTIGRRRCNLAEKKLEEVRFNISSKRKIEYWCYKLNCIYKTIWKLSSWKFNSELSKYLLPQSDSRQFSLQQQKIRISAMNLDTFPILLHLIGQLRIEMKLLNERPWVVVAFCGVCGVRDFFFFWIFIRKNEEFVPFFSHRTQA